MLDESLTSMVDAAGRDRRTERAICSTSASRSAAASWPACDWRRSRTRPASATNSAAIPGESGILSAAGRHWACSVANIRYLEGSYDRHLFRQLLTNEDITFGYGGRAPAIDRPGLGVTVNESVLREQTLSRQAVYC